LSVGSREAAMDVAIPIDHTDVASSLALGAATSVTTTGLIHLESHRGFPLFFDRNGTKPEAR